MVHAGVGEVEDNFEDRGVHEGRHSREDTVFMSLALQEARQAALEDEVPIGAVLVLNGKVLARAHNRVEAQKDPTAHAEMLVIREAAAQQLGRWYLRDATLYVTLEPCAMCAGAVLVSRVLHTQLIQTCRSDEA
ncbi:hypothetical protein WJX75_002452 [Coccomyxa subellipsoidea]|uniref:CMP/dCMP-type deaminase domain-containing protein n=1 Tax=Coccomyxa subellipsoidea TaxID=248742 RepID=A0ABR2YSY1_9CHLO